MKTKIAAFALASALWGQDTTAPTTPRLLAARAMTGVNGTNGVEIWVGGPSFDDVSIARYDLRRALVTAYSNGIARAWPPPMTIAQPTLPGVDESGQPQLVYF